MIISMCDYFYNCSNFVFCRPGASRCFNPIFPGVYFIANSLDGEIIQCSEKEQKNHKFLKLMTINLEKHQTSMAGLEGLEDFFFFFFCC